MVFSSLCDKKFNERLMDYIWDMFNSDYYLPGSSYRNEKLLLLIIISLKNNYEA